MKIIAMIPARLGSQRLKKKNLQLLKGAPLIAHAIRKAKSAQVFDEVWVNSESDEIAAIAVAEGAKFHKRPAELANNQATSEDFVAEFLEEHPCDYVVQLHSIAPLLTIQDTIRFTNELKKGQHDALLSAEEIQIECAYQSDPINFVYSEKTNSQELSPVQRISWSITAWKRSTFLAAVSDKSCATYAGKVAYFPIGKLAGHVIKTMEDLQIAEALFDIVHHE